jgi:hypothetical protein
MIFQTALPSLSIPKNPVPPNKINSQSGLNIQRETNPVADDTINGNLKISGVVMITFFSTEIARGLLVILSRSNQKKKQDPNPNPIESSSRKTKKIVEKQIEIG